MSELVNVTYENDNRRVYHVMTHAPRVQISVHFIRYIITIIFERERKKNLSTLQKYTPYLRIISMHRLI